MTMWPSPSTTEAMPGVPEMIEQRPELTAYMERMQVRIEKHLSQQTPDA